MKLSIIIVNYNTKKLTLNCLKSIDRHPYDAKFEVLTVDNNSSDGSVEALEKFNSKNFNLKIIQNKKNLGFSKANNKGIKASKGEYVLLLNSDTEVKNDSLNNLLKVAENLEDAGVVGAKLLNTDKTVQSSVFKLPTISRSVKQYLLDKKNILDKYAPKTQSTTEVEVVVGAAFLITPEALKKVGTLDEKYFMYFEDFDYCRKIRRKGLKVYYTPKSEIIHHHGASGGDFSKLIASSKTYHGLLRHYLIFLITKIGQKINVS